MDPPPTSLYSKTSLRAGIQALEQHSGTLLAYCQRGPAVRGAGLNWRPPL